MCTLTVYNIIMYTVSSEISRKCIYPYIIICKYIQSSSCPDWYLDIMRQTLYIYPILSKRLFAFLKHEVGLDIGGNPTGIYCGPCNTCVFIYYFFQLRISSNSYIPLGWPLQQHLSIQYKLYIYYFDFVSGSIWTGRFSFKLPVV